MVGCFATAPPRPKLFCKPKSWSEPGEHPREQTEQNHEQACDEALRSDGCAGTVRKCGGNDNRLQHNILRNDTGDDRTDVGRWKGCASLRHARGIARKCPRSV